MTGNKGSVKALFMTISIFNLLHVQLKHVVGARNDDHTDLWEEHARREFRHLWYSLTVKLPLSRETSYVLWLRRIFGSFSLVPLAPRRLVACAATEQQHQTADRRRAGSSDVLPANRQCSRFRYYVLIFICIITNTWDSNFEISHYRITYSFDGMTLVATTNTLYGRIIRNLTLRIFGKISIESYAAYIEGMMQLHLEVTLWGMKFLGRRKISVIIISILYFFRYTIYYYLTLCMHIGLR